MEDKIIPPKAYGPSMIVALGVLIDAVRKEVESDPEAKAIDLLKALDKTEKLTSLIQEMFKEEA